MDEEFVKKYCAMMYKKHTNKKPTPKYNPIVGRLNHPLLEKIKKQYEEWYILGMLKDICEQFGVSENRIHQLVYSKRKLNQTTLDFDTIIRLSNMFDIPYDEFMDYNAYIEHDRKNSVEVQKEEEELLKQYQTGKSWEDRILKYYNDKGYFTYKIPTMNSGTVFDIIAIRKGAALMIECKHIDGDKLYYSGSGILKKRDEIDHFISKTKNNLYIYVNSEKTGTWWTTWVEAKPIFEKKGYITKEDCFPCELGDTDA